MRSRRALAFFFAASVVVATIGFMPGALADDQGTHVAYIRGISNLSNLCEYEWADTRADLPGTQPERDTAGIPRPRMVDGQPVCRDGALDNIPATGPGPVPCALSRNLGPPEPYDRSPDLTAGEVGKNRPCKGDISAAATGGNSACTAVGSSGASACQLNSPTWFYGFCGQTYGGGAGGTFTYGGRSWTINRMGFPRGPGAWEFHGKMTSNTTGHVTHFRYYLGAAPDQSNQLAGCDVTKNISSIVFTGVITIPAQGPRLIAAKTTPGLSAAWHWCDGTDGCG